LYVGVVFPAQERRRHYRSISLLRTRWLHFWWVELPGEMQGQSYAAALACFPFAAGSKSKSRLQVLPGQTIFLRRTVLVGITLCCVASVEVEIRESRLALSIGYTFVANVLGQQY
jgi:hypothetical protein